jgi:hypothetical protein
MPRRVVESKREARSVGRSRLRLMGGVLQDLRKLGVKSWWMVAKDREPSGKVLREAEAHIGL